MTSWFLGRDAARVPTLRARMAISMTLLSVGVLAATGAAIYVGVRYSALSTLDSMLLTIARAEIASATDDPVTDLHVHDDRPTAQAVLSWSGSERVVMIRDARRAVRAQTPNLASGPELTTDGEREAQALAGAVSFADVRRGRDVYRAIYHPLHDAAGRRFVMIVAMSRRPFDRTLQALVVALAVALLAGGAVAGWGATRLARRLTRPLEAIASAARTVGEHSLSARIPEVSEDGEVRGVVAILNAMLARLEAAFAKERQLVMAQRRFVADASHELRSPLSNLRGNVEVALRRPRAADEYRETLGAALGEIERMARLTNALLTLSRIDAGQLELMVTPCELSAIAADAVKGLAARAGQRGICVRLEAHDALEIDGDADRLRAVLDNLLDNALRYAPEGSEIVVTARRENGTATVTVRDEGPGLSQEDQAHVFERFFRADRSRARNSGGAGLGLAIAMALVEAHRGRLTVQSAPGSGAAFSLRLPIRHRA